MSFLFNSPFKLHRQSFSSSFFSFSLTFWIRYEVFNFSTMSTFFGKPVSVFFRVFIGDFQHCFSASWLHWFHLVLLSIWGFIILLFSHLFHITSFASACIFTKSNPPPWAFSRFLDCITILWVIVWIKSAPHFNQTFKLNTCCPRISITHIWAKWSTYLRQV